MSAEANGKMSRNGPFCLLSAFAWVCENRRKSRRTWFWPFFQRNALKMRKFRNWLIHNLRLSTQNYGLRTLDWQIANSAWQNRAFSCGFCPKLPWNFGEQDTEHLQSQHVELTNSACGVCKLPASRYPISPALHPFCLLREVTKSRQNDGKR